MERSEYNRRKNIQRIRRESKLTPEELMAEDSVETLRAALQYLEVSS